MPAPTRRALYALVLTAAAGASLGRIAAVDSVDRAALENHLRRQGRGDARLMRPMLSANDRSRWCTIRALVEDGTYAIDRVVREPGFDTIDMVKHDGHLYSSKPPLLSTLMAAPYWALHRWLGWTFATHPYAIVRTTLLIVNGLPWLGYLAIMAWLAERGAASDWARLFVVAAAGFGTFLSTFIVVINNHLPAAAFAAATIALAVRVWYLDDRRGWVFALAGLCAAMTAVCELPALAFCLGVGAALAWKAPRETALGFVPPVLIVAAASFGANYLAHASWRPPYMHRSGDDNWYDYDYERNGRLVDSYWRHPQGIDRGEPSAGRYALHVLLGHHGVFALTPIWALAALGMSAAAISDRVPWRALLIAIAMLSALCLTFYIVGVPPRDRNYGGMTSGFRWMFWFAPLWLVAALPTLDWAASRRWARGACLALLALSAASAAFPTWNPWSHPWIYQWMSSAGTL